VYLFGASIMIGAEIPRYSLLNLFVFRLVLAQFPDSKLYFAHDDLLPFLFDDFAEAIHHAGIVLCSWLSYTHLQLSAHHHLHISTLSPQNPMIGWWCLLLTSGS